jgi:WD40 repeat protein
MKRFTLHTRLGIEQAPLQIYCSALIFAPEGSLVRKQFKDQVPYWVQSVLDVPEHWDALLQTLEGHSDIVSSVVFSPDGKQLVSISRTTVRLWDVATGAALHTFDSPLDQLYHHIEDVTFSLDGGMVLLAVDGSTGGWVQSWDAALGTLIRTHEIHTKEAKFMVISPDKKTVALGFGNGTVVIWDLITDKVLQTFETYVVSRQSIAISLDGKAVMEDKYSNMAEVLDVTTGEVLHVFKDYMGVVTFSPDGKTVAFQSRNNIVRLWNVATKVAQLTLEHPRPISHIAFSPDSKIIASSASIDSTIWLWDAASGVIRQTLDNRAPVKALAFSPDSKVLAVGSMDRTVRLWDLLATGAASQIVKERTVEVNAVAFSPDGNMLVSASSDGSIQFWDMATGVAQQTLKAHTESVMGVAFSQDGKIVASSSCDDTVRLWDVATGKAQLTLQTNAGSSIAFSPDNKTFVSASWNSGAQLFDFATRVFRPYRDNALQIYSFEFLSDRITTGLVRQIPISQGVWVKDMAFSQDDKVLASALSDGTVRLWSAASGVVLQTLQYYARSLFFSGEGLYLQDYEELRYLHPTSTGVFSYAPPPLQTPYRRGDWIIRREERLLWLHPDYRELLAFKGNAFVFWGASRSIKFLFFKT